MATTRDIEAGRAFVRLVVEDSEFNRQLNKDLGRVDAFANSLQSIGSSLAAAGAALAAPFAGAVALFTKLGSDLQDMSDRTGISARSLSELKFAAEQSGASLRDIGLAAREMQSKGLDPSTFDEVAARIAAIEDPTLRAQAAFDAWGKRAGTALLPMVDNLEELRAKAQELGVTMHSKTAAAAEKFGDAVDQVKAAVTGLAVQVGSALAPVLTDLAEKLSLSTAAFARWVEEHQGLVSVVAQVGPILIGLGGSLTVLAAVAKKVWLAIVAVKAAIVALSVANPAVAIAAAVTALGLLALKLFKTGDAAKEATKGMKSLNDQLDKQSNAMARSTAELEARAEALKRMAKVEQDARKMRMEPFISAEIRREERLRELRAELDRAITDLSFAGGARLAPELARRIDRIEAEIERTQNGPPPGLPRPRTGVQFGGAVGAGQFFITMLPELERRRGRNGFSSPDQVLDAISRDFGPRGTFSGRFAEQMFGTGGSSLPALAKKQIEELQQMKRHLEDINRRAGARGVGPSYRFAEV